MIALWITAGLFGLLVITSSILSGARNHNAKHHLRDEQAKGYGIGGGFINHAVPFAADWEQNHG